MNRQLVLVFGVASYVIALGGLVFFILYVGGWNFLPFHIDSGAPGSSGYALAINVGLLLLMGLQHSVMARPAFKAACVKIIRPEIERSNYVLLSGLVFIAISFFWQPLNGSLWHIENQAAQVVLTVIQTAGWILAVGSSFAINHFELFGLQQVWFYFVSKPEPKPTFTDRNIYRFVRHPLQLGVLIGIWVTATMTMTHLMLSVGLTVYIFIGLYFEERDLVRTLGAEYANFKKRVPMILPGLKIFSRRK